MRARSPAFSAGTILPLGPALPKRIVNRLDDRREIALSVVLTRWLWRDWLTRSHQPAPIARAPSPTTPTKNKSRSPTFMAALHFLTFDLGIPILAAGSFRKGPAELGLDSGINGRKDRT